jgi:hypothetical protein
MLIKKWIYLFLLSSCMACAPVPIDKTQQKTSFLEKVLAKKTTSSYPDLIQPTPKPIASHDSNAAVNAANSASADESMDELAEKLSTPIEEAPSKNAISAATPSKAAAPALLVHQAASNDPVAPQDTNNSEHLLFNINEPKINIVNLTGKPLTTLVDVDTFNNEQLNQSLAQQLEQNASFQLASNSKSKSSFTAKLQPWSKQASAKPAQTNGELSIEARLIINEADQAIGVTLNLEAFDGNTGDAIANTRTYQTFSNNKQAINELIRQAAAELATEVSANWLSR